MRQPLNKLNTGLGLRIYEDELEMFSELKTEITKEKKDANKLLYCKKLSEF